MILNNNYLKRGKLYTPKNCVLLGAFNNEQDVAKNGFYTFLHQTSFYASNKEPLLALSGPQRIAGSHVWYLKFLYEDKIAYWYKRSVALPGFMNAFNKNFKLL